MSKNPNNADFWTAQNRERFNSKVDKSGDCWLWTGTQDGKEYGIFYASPEHRVRAHRAAWMMEVGSITSQAMLDHECRNTLCVRVSHLRKADYKLNRENLSGAYKNSRSGIRGVYWVEKLRKYRVEAQHNKKQYIGGYFSDIIEAEKAAVELRNRVFTYNSADRSQP